MSNRNGEIHGFKRWQTVYDLAKDYYVKWTFIEAPETYYCITAIHTTKQTPHVTRVPIVSQAACQRATVYHMTLLTLAPHRNQAVVANVADARYELI